MSSKLLAIKVRRRSVAVAVFSDRSLEHISALQLCNEPEIVTDTVARFIATILENFRPDSAAIGMRRTKHGNRVSALIETTETMLRSGGIPFWEIEDQHLLESYAVPKLKNQKQLRAIVGSFWPHVSERQLTGYEAAALGLYVQVERLLPHH